MTDDNMHDPAVVVLRDGVLQAVEFSDGIRVTNLHVQLIVERRIMDNLSAYPDWRLDYDVDWPATYTLLHQRGFV